MSPWEHKTQTSWVCSAPSAAKLPGRLEVWIDYKSKVDRSTDLGSERSFLKAGILGPIGVICLFCNAVHSQGAHGHFWIATSILLYRPRCLAFSWRVWELFYIFLCLVQKTFSLIQSTRVFCGLHMWRAGLQMCAEQVFLHRNTSHVTCLNKSNGLLLSWALTPSLSMRKKWAHPVHTKAVFRRTVETTQMSLQLGGWRNKNVI